VLLTVLVDDRVERDVRVRRLGVVWQLDVLRDFRVESSRSYRPLMTSRVLLGAVGSALAVFGASGCGGDGVRVAVTVTPASATLDVPFNIRVTGLRAGESVIVRFDGRSPAGVEWEGSLSVRATSSGVVSLVDDYLLEQMHLPGGGLAVSRGSYRATQATLPRTLRIAVDANGVVVSVLARRHPAAGLVPVEPERPLGVGFYADWRRPKGVHHHTAILLFGGSEGGLSGSDLAAALVAHGYPVLDLAYFREPGLPRRLERIPLEYFERALRWLAARPEVDRRRIVTFGISRGGELSLILASTFPELVYGAVGYVPYFQAVPSPVDGEQPAWTYRGKPVYGDIPVEKIAGPVFVAGGGADALWPSGTAVQRIAERMQQYNRHDLIALIYPNAGHELGHVLPSQIFASPAHYGVVDTIYGQLQLGGSPRADETARENAWPTLLRFLGRIRD